MNRQHIFIIMIYCDKTKSKHFMRFFLLLLIACGNGLIRLWEIPESGLAEQTNQSDHTIKAHTDKIYLIKFHPLAADVLASASYDMTVKIWDLTPFASNEDAIARITLMGHTDQIFSLAWSPCGQYLASTCKDGKLRVYKPRSADVPVKTGKGPVGTRGARVVWALKGQFLVVMGFDKCVKLDEFLPKFLVLSYINFRRLFAGFRKGRYMYLKQTILMHH